MNYRTIFLNNEKVKQVVSRLEVCVNQLQADMNGEQLAQVILMLEKLEQMLELDKEEAIGPYLRQEKEVSNIIEMLKERVGLFQELCKEFSCKNYIDVMFCELYRSILIEMGYDTLYKQMVSNFTKYFVEDTDNATNLLKSYNRTLYWGALDYWTGNYELIKNRAESLIQNADAMLWMYLSLQDYTSKEIMYQILLNWVTFSHRPLQQMPTNKYDQYFDLDLINGSGGEVFIDAGAFRGDTVESFIANFKQYKHIYSYEITPATFEELKRNTEKYENIIYRRCGLSDKSGSMYVELCEQAGGNRLGESGEIEVPVVTLDEDVQEKIDFIKMDIEGGEFNALKGARTHIQREHPKLAIAAYHNNVDIFRLAQLIYEMEPRYQFYFRYYGGTLYPNDYVLFAIYK